MPVLLPEERLGTVVAEKYRLDRILGRGGMGVVFAAVHQATERPVALKVLLPQFSEDATLRDRFFREARAAAKIRHPNVVDVLDLGTAEDGSLYLVLEMLDGEPLGELLDRVGRLSVEEVCSVLLPILEVLQRVHDAGVLHRDIKPDNIFLSRDGRGDLVPKLLDFGIAKVQETSPGLMTKTGSVMGTPQYMSPEQAQGQKDIGPPSDIWSIAVVAYEALSGTRPFDSETIYAVLLGVIAQAHPPLEVVAPDCPASLVECIESGLNKDPARRPQSAEEFAAALCAAVDADVLTRPDGRASAPTGIAAPTESESPRSPVRTPIATVKLPGGEEPAAAPTDTHMIAGSASTVALAPATVEVQPSRRRWIAGALLLASALAGGVWWTVAGSGSPRSDTTTGVVVSGDEVGAQPIPEVLAPPSTSTPSAVVAPEDAALPLGTDEPASEEAHPSGQVQRDLAPEPMPVPAPAAARPARRGRRRHAPLEPARPSVRSLDLDPGL